MFSHHLFTSSCRTPTIPAWVGHEIILPTTTIIDFGLSFSTLKWIPTSYLTWARLNFGARKDHRLDGHARWSYHYRSPFSRGKGGRESGAYPAGILTESDGYHFPIPVLPRPQPWSINGAAANR